MEASEYIRRKYLHEAPKLGMPKQSNGAAAKFRLLWRITLAFNIAATLALVIFAAMIML